MGFGYAQFLMGDNARTDLVRGLGYLGTSTTCLKLNRNLFEFLLEISQNLIGNFIEKLLECFSEIG